MKKISVRNATKLFLLVGVVSVAVLGFFRAASAQNADGTFESDNGWKGLDPSKELISENSNRFVRFKNADANETVAIEGRIAVNPNWKKITMSARMRGKIVARGKEGWYAPRVTFTFRDGDDKMVGDYPAVLELKSTTPNWITDTRDFEVPANATSILLTPGLWGTSGTFDLDDLSVREAGTKGALTPVNATNAPAVDAPLPNGETLTWNSEPVEKTSATRGRIVLNGLWKWMPANGDAPNGGWGWLRVPGSWRPNGMPGIVAQGQGNDWKDFDAANCTRGWYQRTLNIPASWANRRIELDMARVSTDAQIFVNDRKVGEINWPSGTVEISKFVTPGKTATLRVLVVAAPNEGDVLHYMDGDDIIRSKAQLQSAGIIGDVILQSSPNNARISDVFVQPSWRKKALGVQVELQNVKASGNVVWTARLLNEKGVEEKRFTTTTPVSAGSSTRSLNFPWANPRLWDVGQPNLYTLRLEAKGAGLSDDYAQSFGFREFWIQGRDYFLNGTKFRARPILGGDGGGLREVVDAQNREFLNFGFNMVEDWPNDYHERSRTEFRSVLSDSADKIGMPITGILSNMGDFLGNSWKGAPSIKEYEARMFADMKRFRNHPSIIMWGTTANRFGRWDDEDPRHIGRKGWLDSDVSWKREADQGAQLIGAIKKHDPTRPVFTHHGDYVGDVYTSNTYLGVIPLQERIEWLSEYSKLGDMPYWAIEFGTPLYTSLMRGRAGYGPTSTSEPLISEFSAIYQGNASYTNESNDYRDQIRARFVKDQEYTGWHGEKLIRQSSNFQNLQALFHTQTNRAWRTWGLSGGEIPWDDGYRFKEENRETLNIGPFVAGRLGIYQPTATVAKAELSRAGIALKNSIMPTLAYIGGAPEFTEQSHNFRAGQTVQKQVVLLNDQRKTQTYSFSWTAKMGDTTIGAGKGAGVLAVAETKFAPIQFVAPLLVKTAKADAKIELTATIGNQTHRDVFAFRVFADTKSVSRGTISVFDPIGDTSKMLRALGYNPQPWDGTSSTRLLVIGRKAMTPKVRLPGNLQNFVSGGGRAIIMAQTPQYLRDYLGFRTTYHPTRRVFRIDAKNPVVTGLDDTDLRDWAGSGTLVEAYPTEYERSRTKEPYAGWHWGNRGSVASIVVEKPHRAAWRPLLECEFDLAYSPLLELDAGRGRITLCTLDLEDQIAPDAAAQKLARQLFNYVEKAPLSPRLSTVYIGGAKGVRVLDMLGVEYKRATALPNSAQLAILGDDANIAQSALENFARNGGRVVFLARSQSVAGANIQNVASFGGARDVPNWPQAAGISLSDLRWRTSGAAKLLTANANTEIGGGGQIARRVVGSGSLLWAQVDPEQFEADKNTFFRYTRWRQTRALSQILANAGATFVTDARIFRPALDEISQLSLATDDWKAILTNPVTNSPSPDQGWPDAGWSAQARKLVALNADESGMQTVKAPGDWEKYGAAWDKDGEGVFRKTVEIPAKWANQDLQISLSRVDDDETTFWNGEQIGASKGWDTIRVYTIPAAKVKAGKNLISIRVWDNFGGGGFTGTSDDMFIKPLRASAAAPTYYYPDYRSDFEFGDDPYRYYRW